MIAAKPGCVAHAACRGMSSMDRYRNGGPGQQGCLMMIAVSLLLWVLILGAVRLLS